VTGFPKISAIDPADSTALGMAYRRDTKKSVASFQRSGIVLHREEASSSLVTPLVPEEVDCAQEIYLYEQVEDETGNEISSDVRLCEMVAAID
jgi:hypothetical protein